MDFTLDDAQQATRELAQRILGDLVTVARHKELEAAGEWFDRSTWSALADAGLVGIALPEAHGGAGLGFLEVALVLEEIGRTVAKVPYLAAVVLGGLPIAAFGDDAMQARWLPGIADGSRIVTTALHEPGAPPATARATRARRDGAGWVVDGAKTQVTGGLDADAFLVPALADDGVVVLLVEKGATGLDIVRQDTTTGIPEAELSLRATPAAAVLAGADRGAEVLAAIALRATAALAAMATGVCEAALRLTADYTKGREQFGRAIATFQAVGQRAADAYIDTEAVRLTALQAAWRIDEGLPAEAEVAVAKFWAADGGQRVVHAAQHLHGGMGVDRDYPLHRYFLCAKQIELTMGGATSQLLTLGDLLADDRL